MPSNDEKPKAPTPAATPEPAVQDARVPVMVMTEADILAKRQSEEFRARHAYDDEQRAKSDKVMMIANTGFTIHDDPTFRNGREIKIGQEFEISEFDLPNYLGRARRKEMQAAPGTTATPGVTITAG